MMNPRSAAGGIRDQKGMALIAVMVFALIVALVGLSFFAIASYESKGAQYRQRSTEAFYLADGGIERVRGEFLEDVTWRGPIPNTVLGSGAYDVTVADTLLAGEDGVVVRAEGQVGDAERGVEVTGEVRSFLEEWGLVALNDINASGNLTVNGRLHASGNADFGPGDVHLKGGTYDEGYSVTPPPIYTEPQAWGENTTFYRVIGVPKNPPIMEHGAVYKYNWTTGLFEVMPWDIPPSIVDHPQGSDTYTFDFLTNETKNYFDTKFVKDPGDGAVVVDFGQPDATGLSVTDLEFQMTDGAWSLKATLINTRFEGVNESDRVAPCSGFWKGGTVTFKTKLNFAPDNCVALIAHGLGKTGGPQPNAQGSLGTADHPALTYVTGTVNGIKGDLEIWGAIIALCDINSQGGPTVHHDPRILDCIPFDFDSQGSGFFRLREWREVPL